LDKSFFFDRLYPLQDEVLAVIRQLDTPFYLTGGTAASRGYLGHRLSDDLDFFTNDDPDFGLAADRVFRALSLVGRWQLAVTLREERFFRFFVEAPEVKLKVEMVNDVPSRVGEVRDHLVLGRLDSPENILANKITALVDRNEPKDLADIWGFCCKLGLSLSAALEGAHGKAAGIFPPDVARRLCGARRDDWEVVRWIEEPEVEAFLGNLVVLGEGLLLE
jgi:hypothetical protein